MEVLNNNLRLQTSDFLSSSHSYFINGHYFVPLFFVFLQGDTSCWWSETLTEISSVFDTYSENPETDDLHSVWSEYLKVNLEPSGWYAWSPEGSGVVEFVDFYHLVANISTRDAPIVKHTLPLEYLVFDPEQPEGAVFQVQISRNSLELYR